MCLAWAVICSPLSMRVDVLGENDRSELTMLVCQSECSPGVLSRASVLSDCSFL
jgi:hypothetical protein